MTDFDKLIKEKAEQAEYAYKPAAWKSFRQKAGVGRGVWKYWAAGASSALVVGGALVFMLNREPLPEPTVSSSPVAVLADSACGSVQPVLAADTLSVSDVPTSGVQNTRASVTPDPAVGKADESPSVETPAKPSVSVPPHGRPLVIDVDTIKDNVPTDDELRNGHSRLF